MHHFTLELIGFIKKNEKNKILSKLVEIRKLNINGKIRYPKNCNKSIKEHIDYAKDAYVKHFEVIVDYFEEKFGIKI